MISPKKLEIFCGTGGVGKTTLSASRALYLASKGINVLLITIDPSRRLKQLFNLSDDDAGTIHTIKTNYKDEVVSFDGQLLGPQKTLQRIAATTNTEEEVQNPIIEVLTRPHGGMNEVMAMLEVNFQLQTGNYDTIVLDTPPGEHFIDFLNAANQINTFFHGPLAELVKLFGKRVSSLSEDSSVKRFLSPFIASGIKKLLAQLEKVTGDTFIETFIDALVAVYKNREAFLNALAQQEALKNADFSNWFLVTSIEHQKTEEANTLHEKASPLIHNDNYLVINKSIQKELEDWTPVKRSKLYLIKESLLFNEKQAKEAFNSSFNQILTFPEILSASIVDHVKLLCHQWEDHDKG